MRPELRAALHAAAELLPVSSSGHLRATGGGGSDEVAAHLVPLGVTLVAWREDVASAAARLSWSRVGMHALAGGIPSVVGLLAGARRKDLSVGGGLALGGLVLLAADHCAGDRSRWEAGPADGLVLGLAQALALWPGVSRLGTTLAVARMRGFAPSEAPLLAREVGVPVTIGALLHELRPSPPRAGAAAEILASLTGAVAVLPLARHVDRGAPLTPYALERLGLALVLLRQSRAA